MEYHLIKICWLKLKTVKIKTHNICGIFLLDSDENNYNFKLQKLTN